MSQNSEVRERKSQPETMVCKSCGSRWPINQEVCKCGGVTTTYVPLDQVGNVVGDKNPTTIIRL